MRFASLFRGDVDWDGIEGARGQVRASDLPELVAFYLELGDDWPRKMGVLQLVQDQSDAVLEPVMLDVLVAPVHGTWLDDTIELSKAVALGFLDEELDRFMHYYNDRAALKADVDAFLEKRGARVLPSLAAPPAPAPAPIEGDALGQLQAAIETGNRDVAMEALRALGEQGVVGVGAELTSKTTGAQFVTPLMYALILEREELAELFLLVGASPTQARPGGQTPLWWAANKGYAKIVQSLIERGADVNAADQYGGTPLQQARAHVDVARILLDAGAKIDPVYRDGRTPAWFCAYEGHVDTLALLLDRGVDVNGDEAGTTLLHLATRENHRAVVELLLDRSAHVDARDGNDQTPLMHAAQRGYPKLVRILLQAGASRDLRSAGKQAADFATGKRADEVKAALRI